MSHLSRDRALRTNRQPSQAAAATTAAATATSAKRKAWWKLSQLAPAAQPAPANAKHQIAEPISVSTV